MRTTLLLAAAALVAASSASAHHSFGATYDTAKQIKLDGTIVQFVYRNPHSFVHVEAPDEAGVQQRWAKGKHAGRGGTEGWVRAAGRQAAQAVWARTCQGTPAKVRLVFPRTEPSRARRCR